MLNCCAVIAKQKTFVNNTSDVIKKKLLISLQQGIPEEWTLILDK